MKNLKQKH